METIALLPIFLALGWLISKNASTTEYKSDYIQIDEKNWIVKGELVSFEEDTPALRFQQEMEDDKHYRKFENERLKEDRDRIYGNYMKTINGIQEYSHMLKPIAEGDLLKYEDKYQEYLFMCKKLKEELYILTKEQFIIMNENPIWCCVINFRNPLSYAHIYTIHNEETAKYKENGMELMESEFKAKWYA